MVLFSRDMEEQQVLKRKFEDIEGQIVHWEEILEKVKRQRVEADTELKAFEVRAAIKDVTDIFKPYRVHDASKK